MSEVKRYHVTETGLVEGESLGRLSVVMAANYDAAVEYIARLEQLNVLGQETVALGLNTTARLVAERDALQQRLTAADERADVLEGLLANAYETAAKWVEKRCDDYVNEHGSIDPETGTVEFPGDGEEYVGELMEIAEGLRALKPAEGGGDA